MPSTLEPTVPEYIKVRMYRPFKIGIGNPIRTAKTAEIATTDVYEYMGVY